MGPWFCTRVLGNKRDLSIGNFTGIESRGGRSEPDSGEPRPGEEGGGWGEWRGSSCAPIEGLGWG